MSTTRALSRLAGLAGPDADPRLGPAIRTLESLHTWISEEFFGGSLAPATITVAPRGRRKRASWYEARRWDVGPCEGVDEIALAAEDLRAEPAEIAARLLRECVLQHARQQGVKLTSREGRYFSRAFAAACWAVGLIARRDGSRGWAVTYPCPELKTRLAAAPLDRAALDRARRAVDAEGRRCQGTRQTRRVWSCGCQRASVAAGVDFAARCQRCGRDFKEV